MKVSELTGATLDRWVANAHGMMLYTPDWQPSVNWSQGGPIIECEKIELNLWPQQLWQARVPFKFNDDDFGEMTGFKTQYGVTPLEAAMRCYVASKLGEVVDDESI